MKLLGAFVVFVGAVVGAALLVLHTDRGRGLVCSSLLEALNEAIPGEILVEQCAALTPGLIRLEGVRVHDPAGREIAHADAVEAEPDLRALLMGTIRFKKANLETPSLRLIDHGEDLAIASAFAAPTHTTDEDEESPEFSITFGVIEVASGTLTDLPKALSLRNISGRTSLAVGETVSLDVKEVRTEVLHEQETIVRLLDARGALSFGDEADIRVQATLEAQGSQAELNIAFDGPLESSVLSATAKTLGGQIELSAENDAGRVEAHLKAASLDLSNTPFAANGVARGELDAVADFSETIPSVETLERVNAHGSIGFTALALSEMQAEELTIEARIEGRLPTPEAHLVVKADGVEVQGNLIRSLRLTVHGQDGRYHVSGRAPLPNGWIVGLDFGAGIDGARYRLDGKVSLANAPLSPVVAKFSQLVIQPSKSVSVHSLLVTGDGVEARAQGRYGFDGGSDISFDLRSMDLANMKEAFGLGPQLKGTLSGAGRFRGTRDKPELEAKFRLDEGAIESVPIGSLTAAIGYTTLRRAAEADLRVDLGENGELVLRTDARLERAGSVSRALRAARYDARLVIDSLSASVLSRLIEAFPAVDGTISSEITARGELDGPDIDIDMHGRRISSASFPSADVHLEAALERGDLHARFEAVTNEGGTMVATTKAQVNLRDLFSDGGAASILDKPWEVSVQIPEQRWSVLPVEVQLPTPARVSLNVQAKGGEGPIFADIDADVRMPGGPSNSAVQPAICSAAEPARIRARARLRDEQTNIEVEGYLARKHILRAEAQAETPLLAWIRSGFPSKWPVAQARLELDSVTLGSVPIVCEHAQGELQAQFEATGLFNPSQQMSLRLEARKLFVDNDTPVHVLAEAEATATSATVEVGIHAQEQELAHFFAHAPIDVRTAGKPIGLGAGEISASADFEDAPLSVLLAPVPAVARPSGHLDGHLTVSGDAKDLSTLKMRGAVQLTGASMTLKDPFVRLDKVDADLQIEPDRLVVKSIFVEDRDGSIEAHGMIGLSEWEPSEVALTLEADEYPLRRAGVIVATFNGQAELRGDLRTDPRVLRMELGKEVSLVLPEELLYGVQDLGQHPLVIYEGQPGFDDSLSVQEALEKHTQGEAEEEEGAPLIVHVTSTKPLWVRRTDFSVQLSVDLEVHSEERATWIQGDVDMRRGFLVLLNKNFDVQSGTIRFTGATPIDPTVDLSAKHRLRSGYAVTIQVEGRVSSPELTFSSDAPNANTNAEIIALLLGTSRQGAGSQEASSQTRSVLAGLTAGLVGSLARRELGQYAPIIAVESGGTGETTGIRAGFLIGDLIPEAWQDVLLGIYVEGVLAGSEQGPRGGFLLELLFPHQLSTATTYEQPDNWSLDFLWQP